ncbi:unnamed protein product [Owenia fusiformis]|uniref:Transketolase-like pyrimidine-binding domain-containing protein n=1 Tax=Owenia fusiformis TaxID=6347 RepID=A0A8S4PCW6_OWEFU|nr:unnamed protein product [Owenia fusiformis]
MMTFYKFSRSLKAYIELSILKHKANDLVTRCYHTKEGVFGYKPSKPKEYVLDAAISNNRINHSNLVRLVTAYREHGHKKANIDPLGLAKPMLVPELDLASYGLSETNTHNLHGILYHGAQQATTAEVVETLEKLYCGAMSIEYHHLHEFEEREWFAQKYEQSFNTNVLSPERKVDYAKLMLKCQAFDLFLANKFTTVKRYGGEGAESMMGFFDEVFSSSCEFDVEDVVMCMPHRGRLNLLATMLEFPAVIMFQKMKGLPEFPPNVDCKGDVLSHLFTSVDLKYKDKSVHVSLIPNPSHLEANNPVAAGKARAKQQYEQDGAYSDDPDAVQGDKVLCVQIHGDASFAGQGIVPETAHLAYAPHFSVGGSLHLIVNNQVGFTTEAHMGRSSLYSSDVGKIIGSPVIRVNGDFPEQVIAATKLAMEYRQRFRKDIIIDLMCYRRWGHNEMDDPSFTQPLMYDVIRNRKSIPDLYAEKVINEGHCSSQELEEVTEQWNSHINQEIAKVDSHVPKAKHLESQWSGLVQAPHELTEWDTGVATDVLQYIGARSVAVPESLTVHPTLLKMHIGKRLQKLEKGTDIDWATAEALAMGSLLYQGHNVRISGQDVGRGTFSHRHAMLVDQNTDEMYIPLNDLSAEQSGHLEIANSILSEEAVLGFEYGMSIENPRTLVIWEAQFGDFFNGAQIIIDTYVTSGEAKWLLQSGLVMLLPHGMDGAGPEHSSSKIERFLQQCDSKEDGVDGDNVNIHIVNPTTPAQYFHLLRRQQIRNFRKPLIVIAPKTLLRLPAAVSSLSDMAPGSTFKPIIGDNSVQSSDVERVIFCSGKHYYALENHREKIKAKNTAIVRVESLCPFPTEQLQQEIKNYTNAKEYLWCQEEQQNSGAWSFMAPRFRNLLNTNLRYVGRGPLSMPAVGVGAWHQKEAEDIILNAFQPDKSS